MSVKKSDVGIRLTPAGCMNCRTIQMFYKKDISACKPYEWVLNEAMSSVQGTLFLCGYRRLIDTIAEIIVEGKKHDSST